MFSDIGIPKDQQGFQQWSNNTVGLLILATSIPLWSFSLCCHHCTAVFILTQDSFALHSNEDYPPVNL
jgi:hypothetical protein